jgi:6-phosphogluconolactonase (cycloisomerase 2 family)
MHACLIALCALVALSFTPGSLAQSSNPTVSYLYLSSNDGIYGYNIATDGSLTPISGSPFHSNLYSPDNMVNNGTYLFAVRNNGQNFGEVINSFKIEANGALKLTAQTNLGVLNDQYPGAAELFLDKKGETLYGVGYSTFGGEYLQSYGIKSSDGALTHLGAVPYVPGSLETSGEFDFPPKFLSNDKYLYTGENQTIYGWTRTSNGSLAQGPNTIQMPLAPPGYVPNIGLVAAADPANHMAFTFTFYNDPSTGISWGPEQIGIYKADALGNLVTTDTYLTMPTDSTGAAPYYGSYDLQFSPSGKLLAVSGQSGLQVFHFDGISTVTHYTGLLVNTPVYEFRWDNYNHVVAFESDTNRLHIYNVTPTSVTEAPGSPYTLPVSQSRLTIQNLPL